MAALLRDSVFYHIPKTGGSWVRLALAHSGLLRGEVGAFHARPAELADDLDARARPGFCFVRHPLTWYQSYWTHKTAHGWFDAGNDFDARVRADRFPDFLERVFALCPEEHLTSLYRDYTAGCAFVGRTEALAGDLEAILRRTGAAFDPAVLGRLRRANRTDAALRRLALYPRALAEAVAARERAVIEAHGYPPVPERLLLPGG
ncbi:MAG TPA: hypothetical protein VEH84_11355 [Alphaproteobacteria bacterium]|nr:hypothetical protein [Alphaproteobacteria bacterium]